MAQEYQAYLLRLQRSNDREPWRASIQNAHTGEFVRFANEREMLRYLMKAMANDHGRLDQETGSDDLR